MKKDLTQGPIFKSLISLAIPIIGMSFVQMAYNMVDMIWLGRVGSSAVAAVGTASFFTWFGVSLLLIPKVGAEIGISQSLGKKDMGKANTFATNSLILAITMAIIYGIITYIFAPGLVQIFNLEEQNVNEMAISYLRIIALGAPFYYINPTLGGIFTGAGDSKLPFRTTATGLAINILIDPLFIFGVGSFEGFGSNGAAIATIISQAIVSLLFFRLIYIKKSVIVPMKESFKIVSSTFNRILKLGTPVAVQSTLFSIFAIIIAKIVSKWGALPIAVQSVGSQIEALSWMTASGFSTALASFTGQNFGANKWNRIYSGFLSTVALSCAVGFVVMVVFIFGGEQIFSVFIPEPEAIKLGAIYLGILGVSQIFMCLEISTSGAFYGIGKTMPPSWVSIVFTGARIPMALWLSTEAMFGLYGVWWSISISSIFKGVVLFLWFFWIIYKHPERETTDKDSTIWVRHLPSRIRQQFVNNRCDEDKA